MIEQMLRLAVQHHQAGQLPQAEELYRRILVEQPNQPDALHLLGLLASQYQRFDLAIDLMGRAIAIQPANADYHINLGNAQKLAGRLDDAIASYRRALALKPDIAEVYSNLGLALHAQGRWDEAVACHQRALVLKPEYAEGHNNLGNVYRDQQRLDEAIACYERSLALKPDNMKALSNLGAACLDRGRIDEAVSLSERAVALAPGSAEAHCNLGNALRAKERFEEAVAAYERALALNPKFAEAHNNLGAAYHELERYDAAIAACERALELKPNYPQALINLMATLDRKGRTTEAVACYRRVLELAPDLPEAHNNLSIALCHDGRNEEAIAAAERALQLRPSFAEALNNLGPPLFNLGRLDDAIAAYERAIAASPDYAQAHFNLGLMLLMRGDFDRGWFEMEWRFEARGISPKRRDFPQLRWDGTPLEGRVVFVYYEWGFGDTMNFARYVARLGEGSVIVECQAPLKRLMQLSFPQCVWITDRDPLPYFDVHCPLVSLARVLKTTLDTIPAETPYLKANGDDVQTWRTRLAGDTCFKIGIAWAGNKSHRNDRNRSMPLASLAPLQKVAGVSFYSLQKGEPAQQALDRESGLTLTDWTDDLLDFADTAALVENLDLVIAVDTSVVHLAGGLGKPVWTLLPFAPDWRWLLARDDSPWYPTMRLFRQPAAGDWASVVDRVVRELDLLVGSRGHR